MRMLFRKAIIMYRLLTIHSTSRKPPILPAPLHDLSDLLTAKTKGSNGVFASKKQYKLGSEK